MNQYTKLIIDSVEVDLYEAETLPLSITKRVNNLDGDVKGDFSRVSVKIPATKKNINLLGRSRALFPFRIEVDGSPSFSGLAQCRRGKTRSIGYGAIEENYELNLISNNSTWFNLLGKTLLSDCTDTVIDWNVTNVSFGWSGGSDYAFMLIKWREWETFVNPYYGIKYQESTPSLYIVPLIRAAFASIGYTVESDFLDAADIKKLSIPTPIPKKLGADYSAKYLDVSVSLSAPITIAPGAGKFPYDVIDSVNPQNPLAYNVATFEYTVPQTGYYQIDLLMTFSSTVPGANYLFTALVFVNGFGFSPGIGFGFDDSNLNYPLNSVPVRGSGVVYVQTGDVIHIEYFCGTLFMLSPNIDVLTATMKITGEATKEWGMNLDFKFLLRDWRFLDMLIALKEIFKLGFETNENKKTVTIEPLDRHRNKCKYISNANPTSIDETIEGFYKDSETKDYSQIIDYDKEGRFQLEPTEGVHRFMWRDAGDDTESWVQGVNNLKIYDANYLMGNGADLAEDKPWEVPFFVKTIHVSDVQARYPNTLIIPQFPLIYPKNYVLDPTATEDDADFDIEPRLMFHMGRRVFLPVDEGDGSFELYDDATLIGPSSVPATFMVNYNDTTWLDPSLSFANETVNGVTVTGLLQNYHLQNTLRQEIGEIREDYVRFNSIDNNNFTFRIKAFIDGQKFIVQEIEGFNPLTDSPTNFKFYLDVHPTAADVAKIQNTPLAGVISLLSA